MQYHPCNTLGGNLPYAFTEYGVLMLANILKSERAIQVSIKIIEFFVKLCIMLVTHNELKLEMELIKKKMAEYSDVPNLRMSEKNPLPLVHEVCSKQTTYCQDAVLAKKLYTM